MNWILKNWGEILTDLISGMMNFFDNLINNLFVYVADANLQNRLVTNAATYTTLLGIALITFFGIKQYFTTYVMETDGDPDADPLDILVRCSQAVAICCSNDFIFTYFLEFSKAFVTDLAGSPGSIDIKVSITELVNNIINGMTTQGIIFATILLIMVIGLIVFCVIAGIRGAELSFMKILLPIMAVDLVTTNRERWNSFLASYIMIFLYYGIQLLSYRMFMFSLADVNGTVLSKELIVALGWFVLMLRSPKWMEKFIYSSGLGRATGGALRTASFVLPKFL
jgi:hypothetical protein